MSSSLSIAVQKDIISAPLQKSHLAKDMYRHGSKLGIAVQPTCTGTCSPEQRTFQAVREKVLPAEPMRMQRSRMPGRLRMDTCLLPLKTRVLIHLQRKVPDFCQQALALQFTRPSTASLAGMASRASPM